MFAGGREFYAATNKVSIQLWARRTSNVSTQPTLFHPANLIFDRSYLAMRAINAGIVSHNNPLMRKNRNPQNPNVFTQLFNLIADILLSSFRRLKLNSLDQSPLASALTDFGSTGKLAACQASQPPVSALAFDQPALRSSCATRALVASFGQAQ